MLPAWQVLKGLRVIKEIKATRAITEQQALPVFKVKRAIPEISVRKVRTEIPALKVLKDRPALPERKALKDLLVLRVRKVPKDRKAPLVILTDGF